MEENTQNCKKKNSAVVLKIQANIKKKLNWMESHTYVKLQRLILHQVDWEMVSRYLSKQYSGYFCEGIFGDEDFFSPSATLRSLQNLKFPDQGVIWPGQWKMPSHNH